MLTAWAPGTRPEQLTVDCFQRQRQGAGPRDSRRRTSERVRVALFTQVVVSWA